MKTLLATILMVAFTAVYVPVTSAYTWTVSSDALAFGNTVVVGTNAINFAEIGNQPAGIFGAGFTLTGNSASVKFDSDLYTWDSYNAPNSIGNGMGGYYDAFIVTISTEDFYWNLPHTDPISTNASTFVWGGNDWDDEILESYVTAPGLFTDSLFLSSGTPDTTYYVSFVLDTLTLPGSDQFHPSWGSFHVAPVPEPGTIVLLGAGLLGLGFFGRRRMKKS